MERDGFKTPFGITVDGNGGGFSNVLRKKIFARCLNYFHTSFCFFFVLQPVAADLRIIAVNDFKPQSVKFGSIIYQ